MTRIVVYIAQPSSVDKSASFKQNVCAWNPCESELSVGTRTDEELALFLFATNGSSVLPHFLDFVDGSEGQLSVDHSACCDHCESELDVGRIGAEEFAQCLLATNGSSEFFDIADLVDVSEGSSTGSPSFTVLDSSDVGWLPLDLEAKSIHSPSFALTVPIEEGMSNDLKLLNNRAIPDIAPFFFCEPEANHDDSSLAATKGCLNDTNCPEHGEYKLHKPSSTRPSTIHRSMPLVQAVAVPATPQQARYSEDCFDSLTHKLKKAMPFDWPDMKWPAGCSPCFLGSARQGRKSKAGDQSDRLLFCRYESCQARFDTARDARGCERNHILDLSPDASSMPIPRHVCQIEGCTSTRTTSGQPKLRTKEQMLRHHLKCHSLRLFPCAWCNSRFVDSSKVAEHQRTVLRHFERHHKDAMATWQTKKEVCEVPKKKGAVKRPSRRFSKTKRSCVIPDSNDEDFDEDEEEIRPPKTIKRCRMA